MNNKPWKEWKTRKLSFVGVVCFWIIYIVFALVLSAFGILIPDTITDNVFTAGEWIVGSGCFITVADIMKPKSNKDEVDIQ